jgi:outer membrane protein
MIIWMNRVYRVAVTLFPIMGIVFSGCGVTDRYTYSSIYAEYADSALPNRYDPDGFQEETKQEVADVLSAVPLEKPVTIEKILSIALKNNPELNQARFRIQQAMAMSDLSNAAFWPTIGFYTEYMQGDAPSSYLFKAIDQRKLPPDANFNDPGWFENYETGLNARMNLFNSGKDYLAAKRQKKMK